jgi:predicted short-subunit dehydrogenase-like oxidoreductase (DUF2520 family)
LNFYLVGPGKIGISCSVLLVDSGHGLTGCFSRSEDGCRRLEEHLGSQVCTTLVTDSMAGADFVLVATPDSVLPEMGRTLAHSGFLRPGQVVFHLSGLFKADILRESLAPEIHCGSIHPVQAVASIQSGIRLLRKSDFTVEGDEKAVEMATPDNFINETTLSLCTHSCFQFHGTPGVALLDADAQDRA